MLPKPTIRIFRAVLLGLLVAMPAFPQAVVPTAEGQFGETPDPSDELLGARIESVRGATGDILFGGVFVPGGVMPSPPEMQFLSDMIHGYPEPVPLDTTPSLFESVAKVTPAGSRSRNAAADGDFVAFSFAVDGSMPETLTVRIATYDETGTSLVNVPIVSDVDTFVPPFPGIPPDPTFAKTGVAVDNQGRATVAYTEFNAGLPEVKAMRIDAVTGAVIDPAFLVAGVHGSPDVALLDPAGNRLVITTAELFNPPAIKGHIIDFTGGTPVVGPEFAVSTTVPSFANLNPAVATDPATGTFTAVWEHFDDQMGNPVDVRARRFDAMGNPIGDDFVVNTTTASNQGQPAVAYGQGGNSAVVWATPGEGPENLDVFGQAYDAMGNPIGGEFRVNTETDAIQDRPAVSFLPELDALGQPQFVVNWRDVGVSDGTMATGTGNSYKCFSIGEDPTSIFADGFESGDTSSWSDSQP